MTLKKENEDTYVLTMTKEECEMVLEACVDFDYLIRDNPWDTKKARGFFKSCNEMREVLKNS